MRLKAMAVQGYALSKQGRKALGYRGDQMAPVYGMQYKYVFFFLLS